MEEFLPTSLMDVLAVSVVFSVILMALIQKFKTLKLIHKSSLIWFLNLLFAFLLGIPFAYSFYNLSIIDSVWTGLFSFIGAPSIYTALKNQTLISYKPKSISDVVTISKENEIVRDDV